jgi:monovalent cation:H+ antiporter, CPA1 family
MTAYSLAATLISIAALFSYINSRWVKMQPSAALMLGALLISIVLAGMHAVGSTAALEIIKHWVVRSDLQNLLLNGMLSFLLFAGALQLDVKQLKKHRLDIASLASMGTIISTVMISFGLYWVCQLFHLPLSKLDCALFGALISPTDPVAVLSTFKHLKAPKDLSTCVSGEALFNDGVGIVIFLTLLSVLQTNDTNASYVATLFLREAVGGIVFGTLLGMLGERMLRTIADAPTAIFLTIALVAGGYALAQHFAISGPLAMVMAGLLIDHEISDNNSQIKRSLRRQMANFWEATDDILNAVLFTLLGFELLVVHLDLRLIGISLVMIVVVLLTRLLSVSVPIKLFGHKQKRSPNFIAVLTWGGLRGGLALALAMSLPAGAARGEIIAITFVIVAFAVLVQSNMVQRLLTSKA